MDLFGFKPSHLFRCCLNCGSLFPQKNRFLCAGCWQLMQMDKAHRKSHRRVSGMALEVLCLWDWFPDANDALSKYLVSLKGLGESTEWEFLAQLLVLKRAQQAPPLRGKSVLIPAPSLRPRQEDHAFHLAQALSVILQIPLLPALVKQSWNLGPERKIHQRGLSKQERAELSVVRHENFSQSEWTDGRVIFIDDVLTTGQTAAASLKALSPMKGYEIWCLAQRALL